MIKILGTNFLVCLIGIYSLFLFPLHPLSLLGLWYIIDSLCRLGSGLLVASLVSFQITGLHLSWALYFWKIPLLLIYQGVFER